jgi:hypothetical protein
MEQKPNAPVFTFDNTITISIFRAFVLVNIQAFSLLHGVLEVTVAAKAERDADFDGSTHPPLHRR